MSELNARQWALYNYLKERGDEWTLQVDLAYALKEYYRVDFWANEFHDSTTRHIMTADIRALNESAVIQKVILSGSRGVKIANAEEFECYIGKEIMAAVRRLNRAKRKAEKGNRDGQMRLVLNTERDTVKAFIDSDKATGERLRSARLKKGMTAAEVVLALQMKSVDAPMLSRFEKGYALPNKTTLKELSIIYGVSPEYILYGEIDGDSDTTANKGLASGKGNIFNAC